MHQYNKKMSSLFTIVAPLLALSIGFGLSRAAVHNSIDLRMPSITLPKNEIYLCAAYKIERSGSEFLVGFNPRASASKSHHLLIYGCSAIDAADPNEVWDCGTMMIQEGNTVEKNSYRKGGICARGTTPTVLYAWALDAPELTLPTGVGFEVGGNSGTDHGITKRAGMYLLENFITIPVGLVQNTLKCRMKQDIVIHPIRFRTHTHNLGIEVGFYKFPQGDQDRAILIGKADPQQPQMFHPVIDNSLTIEKGDVLMSYCNFNNTRGKTVNWGQRYEDEMCIVYLMYWVGLDEHLNQVACQSGWSGPA